MNNSHKIRHFWENKRRKIHLKYEICEKILFYLKYEFLRKQTKNNSPKTRQFWETMCYVSRDVIISSISVWGEVDLAAHLPPLQPEPGNVKGPGWGGPPEAAGDAIYVTLVTVIECE